MAYTEYLQDLKEKKTVIKAFLINTTMLQGKVTSFDDDFIIIDSCLVNIRHLISIKLAY